MDSGTVIQNHSSFLFCRNLQNVSTMYVEIQRGNTEQANVEGE